MALTGLAGSQAGEGFANMCIGWRVHIFWGVSGFFPYSRTPGTEGFWEELSQGNKTLVYFCLSE